MEISTQLMNDTIQGLSKSPRRLLSKYFYDDIGSELFSQIMNLPEYYLTRAELEIVSTQASSFFDHLKLDESVELIELGAGDGTKVLQLLRFLEDRELPYRYVPIDISQKALDNLSEFIRKSLPKADVQPHCGDYFQWLSKAKSAAHSRVILFLGSNIGNFAKNDAVSFLKSIRELMTSNDRLVVGFDLIKHPKMIRDAYNDKAGLTKAFNLNLLSRLNAELDADFELSQFDHYESYDPELGEARSYIISLKEQTITIKKANFSMHLNPYEFIHVEVSRKYTLSDIHDTAKLSGFEVNKCLYDCKHYFTDCILTPYYTTL